MPTASPRRSLDQAAQRLNKAKLSEMMLPEDDATLIKPQDDDLTRIKPRPYPQVLNGSPEQDGKFNDDYSLRGAVGVGGGGQVLLGFDERIGREVAIKELLDQAANDDVELSARFLREARITGRLEHPGIVPVYDLGTKQSGAPYYVMRLVRGDTLAKALKACNDEVLAEHALSRRLGLLDRLIDVCEAVAYAHSKGVIHRDIKPGNIVLGPFGETIVLDWGLAKVENEADLAPLISAAPKQVADDADLTRIGDILGTPAYMAPEQANPDFGVVDTRSDVFALGCILYYLLAGHPPLSGSADEILAQLSSLASMPSARDPKLPMPPELIAICDKALSKDKSLRFPNAAALADELRAYRDGRLVSAYAYSRGELLRRFIARNKVVLAASLAVLLAILIGAGLAFKFGVEAHKARNLAVAEGEIVKQEKQQVERALADVTRISNQNLTAANQIADSILGNLNEMRMGMQRTAESLNSNSDLAASSGLLESLLQRYPRGESFATTRAPGTIVAVAPGKYRQALGADTSQLEHNRMTLERGVPILSRIYQAPEGFPAVTMVVPIKQGKTIPGFISMRIKPVDFLGGLLAEDTQTQKRTVWVVQDDGLLLYDSDPQEIGLNLFREERFNQIPELRQLAAEIADQDAGVGYYQSQSAAQSAPSRQIAAWVSLRPAENRGWKVVVLEAW
ncbi:serine/threonine protein kinase [Methylomonas sp. OY6]|uniref:Serine/threonine protein kinase n=1 Tax=Methylomonas defluvii TaxID=3045149 RepID=A0ABU4UCB2_9GAMM|nr:serine/threonine protein kinase [Methylomonas sp. OY6]MDX8127114.1 serine/threonine protein kinase [Methylomonas sp. OY6]